MPVTPDLVGDRILTARGSGVAAGLKELEKLTSAPTESVGRPGLPTQAVPAPEGRERVAATRRSFPRALAFLTSRLNCEERTGISMSDVEVAEQLLGTIETLTLAVVQLLHGSDGRRVWYLDGKG